ncbi:hypothetical protein G6F37_002548 [Rhizopus arrhizus]|nr:hypothetical protein G6F38_001048 [Rhizopus arrhizus]KAG1162006.1 hypothetical protein G6F37_002548 [Rhizopus arrhizus]
MTTPSSLQKSFNELFESQARRENEASFQAKKRKYKEIDLEPYNNISVYSEFFQDPELISEISADAHRIYKKMQVKISRIRPRLEAVTDKRPQAKDVLSTRVMDNEHDQILDSAEAAVRENQFYVNPIVPKRRMYIRENSAAASPSMSQSTDDIDEGNNNEPQLDNNPDPQISSSVEDTRTSFELRDIFDNIAALVEQSPLNSVGSTYLYTLLNRQHDPASYIYTMPEVSMKNTPVYNVQLKIVLSILQLVKTALTGKL